MISGQDHIRQDVKKVNPSLAKIIDQISPDKSFKLIRASYKFGDYILKQGELFLPTAYNSVSIKQFDQRIRDQLSYSSIPLFLTLENCNEVFIDTGSRIIPLNLFYPGNLLGLFESIDALFGYQNTPEWSMTAGARSIFMLQKINRLDGIKRLRFGYGLSSNTKTQDIKDHWDVFRQIAKHPSFSQHWQHTALFFSKEWFAHKEDPAWFNFYSYLYQQSWQQAKFSIDKIKLALHWESFVDTTHALKLRLTPYLADQIKHIMLIGAEKWPGFRPSDDSKIAPIKGIQEAFHNTYQLKKQSPTLMHATLLNQENKLPVYYSLAFPTLLEGSPHSESSATIMLNLREIKNYLNILTENIIKNNYRDEFLKKLTFSYYHVEPDKYKEILLSTIIPKEDNFFQNFTEDEFCHTSPFWRGCIKINYHDNL